MGGEADRDKKPGWEQVERKGFIVKKGLIGTLVLGLLVVAAFSGPALATHCDTGRFCAFDGTSYGHPQLLSSAAAAGTDTVNVSDNQTSSAKNRTGNRWCGVQSGGWPDQTIFVFAPNSWYSTIGTASNKIDHFYVRSSSNQCD